ncbi:MAG TPA: hypothetical protein VMU29_06150 [Smithella sp.]|nr:hypothetical protein [Smithella sp.]
MKDGVNKNQKQNKTIDNKEHARCGDSRAASGRANACEHEEENMAESVTRHVLISDSENIEYLICGIDTLDVGFYVEWGEEWKELKEKFDDRKELAKKTDGNLIDVAGIRPHIFYASGKAPNYRYHIKFPEYHCFISIAQFASHSPNIYISFTSEALHWELSDKELIELVEQDIKSLGGIIVKHKISRCDLYADFRIPGGLSFEFVKSHMVGKAKDTSHFMNGKILETFYVGAKNSPIQLRIYDKGKEIKKKGTEERWLLLWFIDDPQDVWRIEFQIRRPILKQYCINTIDDLRNAKADLWKYATCEWLSLRCLDNENQARRTIHEFWKKVQSCIQFFGLVKGAVRNNEKNKIISIRWYVSRISSFLIPCAAILRDYDLESCSIKVFDRIVLFDDPEKFKEKARKKSIELGIPIESKIKETEPK